MRRILFGSLALVAMALFVGSAGSQPPGGRGGEKGGRGGQQDKGGPGGGGGRGGDKGGRGGDRGGPGGDRGGPGGPGGGGMGRFEMGRVLPPFMREQLDLSELQEQELTKL